MGLGELILAKSIWKVINESQSLFQTHFRCRSRGLALLKSPKNSSIASILETKEKFEKISKKVIDKSVHIGYTKFRCDGQAQMCGCSSMVEHQPSKLDTWVRFPSPAYAIVA